MARRDIIVVGCSAGGLPVLTQLMRGLPSGLPASLFVVSHLPSSGQSTLPEILSRAGHLLAVHPVDGEVPYPGHVYVARPDHHMVLEAGLIRLDRGARENRHRPSIDALFRSAARVYGFRVIGVILSGALQDGVAGLMAVRQAGGIGVVQDPAGAEVVSMPLAALEIAGAEYSVGAADLPRRLVELVHQDVEVASARANDDAAESNTTQIALDLEAQGRGDWQDKVSTFTCPECGGSLWQLDQAGVLQFRCHVGHAYHPEALLDDQQRMLEAALWTAVRTYRDKGLLARQLAARMREQGDTTAAGRFEEEGKLADQYGALIQQHVLKPTSIASGPAPESPTEPGRMPSARGTGGRGQR